MKNIAGIYGDIKGRSFEFLHFYATKVLRKQGVEERLIKLLIQSLKVSDLEKALDSWRVLVGPDITAAGMRYAVEHTPYEFTDDTILTIATMDAILRSGGAIPDFASAYHTWSNKYAGSGFGGQFREWMGKPFLEALPYGSFGNGSAMRVGPIGYLEKDLRATAVLATASAECTHNSPEGIRGARAVADVIFLGRNGNSKKAIKRHIEQTYFYDLWPLHSTVQKSHKFDATCQGSVPEAIICFLEARSIEQAIDLAISLGGDADTQAMMAGSMAEAFYTDVPAFMIAEVRAKLPTEMFDVIERYNKMLAS